MTETAKKSGIKKAAFIYLTQTSEVYYLGNDVGYSVQRRPQLGLQYLCAVLEKRGIGTNIFDQTVTPFSFDQLAEKLKEYDMAGFYCSDPQEEKVKIWCKRLKEIMDIPLLVGGPCTLNNATFLDHGCDVVVHGEAETTIGDLVDYFNGSKDIKEVKGISYKNENNIVTAPPQDLIQDLDKIPFPDRSKVDINAYHDYFLFGMRKPYITVIASRGCAHKCYFCTSFKIWGRKYRRRSVDNVIAEIDDAISKYGAKYIAFQDDIFGMTNDWIEDFSNKLIKKPYRIKWMAILHPFNLRTDTERILRLMKKAGCDTLSFGLQSAHSAVLKNTNRDPGEPDALAHLLKIAKRLGFVTAVAYIFGLPGDTRETVQATIDYSLECGSSVANYFMLFVLRGSDMETLYKDKKICELSSKEIEDLATHASKRFYMRPETIFRLACFMIRNPSWLIGVGKNLPSILARVGFSKAKDK